MQQYFFSFLSSKIQILLDIRCFCLLFFFFQQIYILSCDSIRFYYYVDFINLPRYFFFFFFADFINMLSSDSILLVFFFQQIFVGYTMICICSNLQILLLIGCLFIYIIALQNCVGYSFFFFLILFY